MIEKKILKDERMMIPIMNQYPDCKETMETIFTQYIELMNQYNVSEDLIGRLKIFREKISTMYNEFFLGHQNNAYKSFKDALKGLTEKIGIVTSTLPHETLYRARKNEGNLDYNNDEMFHIKFDERGKVQTQRFSFPGLPCLYLGGSSYVCWMELNRPQFDQFQVAAIRQSNPNTNFQVIDLCRHPLEFYNNPAFDGSEGDELENNILKYLQWWPVMAASSISVKNDNDPFKPEYIFPQFMLQYLLEELDDGVCIGIKYMSIKVGKVSMKQYESDYRTYTSYAIPIRTPNDDSTDGFCSFLKKEFEVTRNYSGKELQVLTDSIRASGTTWDNWDLDEPEILFSNAMLYSTNDIDYQYDKSIFRRIELILESKNLVDYDEDGKMKIEPISKEEIEKLFEK